VREGSGQRAGVEWKGGDEVYVVFFSPFLKLYSGRFSSYKAPKLPFFNEMMNFRSSKGLMVPSAYVFSDASASFLLDTPHPGEAILERSKGHERIRDIIIKLGILTNGRYYGKREEGVTIKARN